MLRPLAPQGLDWYAASDHDVRVGGPARDSESVDRLANLKWNHRNLNGQGAFAVPVSGNPVLSLGLVATLYVGSQAS